MVFGAIRCTFSSCKNKNEFKQTFEKYTTNITNFIVENSNRLETTVVSLNLANIENTKFKGCTLGVKQDAEVDLLIINEVDDSFVANLISDVSEDLTNDITQKASADAGLAGAVSDFLGARPNNENKTELKNKIVTHLEKTINKDSINEMLQDVNEKNELKLNNVDVDVCDITMAQDLCAHYDSIINTATGDEKKALADEKSKCLTDTINSLCKKQNPDGTWSFPECNFEQNTQVKLVAQNIVSQIFEAMDSVTAYSKVDTTADQTAESGEDKTLLYVLIAVAVIIGLGILGYLLYYLLTRPKSKPQGNFSNLQRSASASASASAPMSSSASKYLAD